MCVRTVAVRPERWASEVGRRARALRRRATTEIFGKLGGTQTESSTIPSSLECSIGEDDLSVTLPDTITALFVFVPKAEDSLE